MSSGVSIYISRFYMNHRWEEKGGGPRASASTLMGPAEVEAGKSIGPCAFRVYRKA